jgi:hypothetical protein
MLAFSFVRFVLFVVKRFVSSRLIGQMNGRRSSTGRSGRFVRNSQFFWSMLNAKSEDIGRSLIKNFGGHHHKREENTVWRTVLILDEPDQRIWAETLQACGMRVAAASDAGSTPEIGCDDGTVVVPISECSARADSRFSVDLLPSRRP